MTGRTPARQPRGGIFLLSLAGFFGIFSTTMSKSPVLPLFVKSLSASETVIGLIAAISPLAGVLFSFPVGVLADRLGKKRLLLVSGAVLLAAPVLYLLVRNPFWLIPIRFFHGIATAILSPVASAYILGAYPQSKGEKLGLFSSATLVGRTLAPLLGGAIITWFLYLGGTLPYRAVYVGAFLLAVPAFVLILMLDRGTGEAGPGPDRVTPRDFFRGLRDFLGNRRLLGTSLVEMATYFAYGILETYLPLYLSGLGVPPIEIGLVFFLQVLSIALTKPAFGRLADRVDRRIQVLAGITLLAAATALIPLSASIIVVTLVSVVFGLAVSVSTVATSSYVAEVVKKEQIGASIGGLSSIMDIGHSSGPFVAGVIITAVSIPAGFFAGAAACVLAIGLFSAMVLGRRADGVTAAR
ncbi:MAG TPA: MFS transporter [Spirochaetia bacterium]|nr:MFS transporter [Spirochaetia bacterium]